jgi:hypothetical protein
VVVYNENKVVQLRGALEWWYQPQFVIFKSAIFDVGQSGNGRFLNDHWQYITMFVLCIDINGRVKEGLGVNQTKHCNPS